MPRGDKSAYTDKQKRQAHHIEESYRERGEPQRAEEIAYRVVNKQDGGGKKSGSGRKPSPTTSSSRKSAARTATRKQATRKSASR